MPDAILPDSAADDPNLSRVTAAMREMRGLMEMRHREGFWPVPGRKSLLQSPIWHDPRVAMSSEHGGKMFFLWKERGFQQAIGTSNIQPTSICKDATGSYNPGGLLQWMDLDLMMFLSALFTDRQDKVIDADQRNIFDAIGYQSLDDPPYEVLRSAIKRLTGTQIWDFEETEQGEIQYRALPPLLITTDQEKRLWVKDGRRVRLVVGIGPGWVSEVRADNQVVDLNSYLYLVREIRNGDAQRRKRAHVRFAAKQSRLALRGGAAADDKSDDDDANDDWRDIDRPPDMARAVLLFCDSLRRQQADKSFITVAKTDWLMERFADRHTPIPYVTSSLDLDKKVKLLGSDLELSSSRKVKGFFGDTKRPDYKFLDMLHEKGKIRRSLDALAKLRIFKHYQVEGDKIIIEWNDPRSVPRLEVRDRALRWNDSPVAQVGYTGVQRKFIVTDKLTGSLHFVDTEDDARSPVASPAPESTSPSRPLAPPVDAVTKSKTAHASKKSSVLDAMDHTDISETQARYLRELHAYYHLPPKVIKEAIATGWSAKQLFHMYLVVLWGHHQGDIRKHVAFAISELSNADPQKYDGASLRKMHGQEYLTMCQTWAFAAGGPLCPVTAETVPASSSPGTTSGQSATPSTDAPPAQQPPSVLSPDISAALIATILPALKQRIRDIRSSPEASAPALSVEREELVEAMAAIGAAQAAAGGPQPDRVRDVVVELLTAVNPEVRAAAASYLARVSGS
jgi:hypothetical protein